MIVSNYSFTCFLLVQSQWFAKPLGCFRKICRLNWKMWIVTIFSLQTIWKPFGDVFLMNLIIQQSIFIHTHAHPCDFIKFEMVKRYCHQITSIQFSHGIEWNGRLFVQKVKKKVACDNWLMTQNSSRGRTFSRKLLYISLCFSIKMKKEKIHKKQINNLE